MRRPFILLVLVLASLLAPELARAAGSGVGFTSPAAGATVRRTVTVAVTADDTATSVLFQWSHDGSAWTTIGTDADGSDGWSIRWDTAGAPDGKTILRATATLGDGSTVASTERVHVDNTAPVVTVSVLHPAFSPNGDGHRDRDRVVVRLSEPATMGVHVLGPHGVVATLASKLAAPAGATSFTWDGLRAGHRVPDGVYTVRAVATDSVGNKADGSARVRVDVHRPVVRWGTIADPVSRGPVDARFSLRDVSGVKRASVALLDEAGVVRNVRVAGAATGANSQAVSLGPWHGTPLMPALYRVRVAVTDQAGNTRVSSERAVRLVHPVTTAVWRGVDGAGRRVALTFDDCNEDAAWNRILDILQSHGLHTTFFCIGGNVERYASTARRAVALGDSVGDHTWDHRDLAGMSLAAQEAEIRKQAEAWWKVARVVPLPYFRPPYGAYDSTTLQAAGRLGFSRLMMWDVDPQDWRRPGASVIASKVLGAIHPGAIVVMHVQAQTADALPAILDGLRKRHLEQSSLPELFAAAGMR